MHFLLINQFFAPDPAPTGQLLADVARSLLAEGHTVRVVCSRDSYQDFDAAGLHGLEQADIRRVAGASFGANISSRVFAYARFFAAAFGHSLIGRRPDAIVTLTTPPLLSLAGTAAKILRGPRHIIWEMDVYPDVAVALGMFAPAGLLDRTVGALADFSRCRANTVIALGACMRQRLRDRGIPPNKIEVAENWVDGTRITPRPFPPSAPLQLLYSGNLGRAHDVDTIASAMRRLSASPRHLFLFAGGGARRTELEEICRSAEVTNARFLPYSGKDSLADHLGQCHVGLVTQQPATCGTVVPSKTYALMAAGRPFIFIGPREATPARWIERHHCGWHIEPGNCAALVELLELLSASPALIYAAGARARSAFTNLCDMPAGVARIVSILTAQPGQTRDFDPIAAGLRD